MTPLERAARELFVNIYPGRTIDEAEPYVMQTMRLHARAVLQAIRDVDSGSPAILVAGKKSLYSCSEDPELEDARKCWQAMIDAALAEGDVA